VYYHFPTMNAPSGLIETLFSRGIVRMGPSRHDPGQRVATFDPEAVSKLAADRAEPLSQPAGPSVWDIGE
jgi:hypothetical protein